MALIEFRPIRYTTRTADGIEVRVPPLRNYSVVFFIACWLSVWVQGETHSLSCLLRGAPDYCVHSISPMGLVMWLFGVGAASFACIWNLAGVTQLKISARQLRLIQSIGPIRRVRDFDTAKIRRLRVEFHRGHKSSWHCLAFDYGGDGICFARGALEEPVFNGIVEDISRVLPQLLRVE